MKVVKKVALAFLSLSSCYILFFCIILYFLIKHFCYSIMPFAVPPLEAVGEFVSNGFFQCCQTKIADSLKNFKITFVDKISVHRNNCIARKWIIFIICTYKCKRFFLLPM